MTSLYFGGTFDPIHHGHLICGRTVAEQKGFDQVVLVPTFQPPHKANAARMADPADRLAMCRLAVAADPLFAVDDLELRRTGPTYTIDTVRQLKANGIKKVCWLIGADMLLYLPYWHKPQEVLEEMEFMVVARPGCTIDWQLLPAAYRHLQQNVVEAPMLQISSTDVRQRVADGKPIDYLTPSPVCDYIKAHGLYHAH